MQRHRNTRRHCIRVLIAGLGIPAFVVPVVADSVPESIRIQQQAEKAYETAPVVPIERGNAHHRDVQKDDLGGEDVQPVEPLPPPRPVHRDNSR